MTLRALLILATMAGTLHAELRLASYKVLLAKQEVIIVALSGTPLLGASPAKTEPSVLHVFRFQDGTLVSSFRSRWESARLKSFISRHNSIYTFSSDSAEIELFEVGLLGATQVERERVEDLFPELKGMSAAKQLLVLQELCDQNLRGLASVRVARPMLEEFDPQEAFGSSSASADQIVFSDQKIVIFVDWEKNLFCVSAKNDPQCITICVE